MADEQKTVIIDVEVEDNSLDKKIGDINTELKENRNQIKELNKDYKANAKEIAALENKNKDLSASKRELIKDAKAEKGSLNELRRELSKQTAERNNLNKTTAEGAKRFDELQLSIAGLNEEISGFEQAGGDFRRNVGNYPDLLGAANEATGGFISTLTGLLNPLTAVAGAVAAVGAAYVKTGRGSADLARAQDRLSTAFIDVGNSVADIASDDKGGVLDKFLRRLQEQFFGLASTLRSDVIVAIKEQIREFQLAQVESDRLAKSLLDQAEQQRQIRDEERNTLSQRRKANEDLLATINEREAEQIKTQERQIANLQVLLKLDEGNLELQLQLKQAEFELADIREEAQGFRSEQAINDLALARESAQQRSELRKLELEEILISVEEGSRREFEVRQQIINETLAIELEAVGNNVLAKQILEQDAKNELLALEEEFIAEKIDLINKTAAAEDKARNEELRKEKAQLAQEKKLKDKAAKDDAKREALVTKGKTQLREQAFAAGIELLGAESEAGKAVAIAQSAINTFQGVTAALTVPAPVGIALGAVVGAIGALNIAKIAQTDPMGGAGGGVSTGVSSGAGVSSVNSTLFSSISNGAQTQQDQAQATGQAVGENLPPIMVAVTDINTAQAEQDAKQAEVTLG